MKGGGKTLDLMNTSKSVDNVIAMPNQSAEIHAFVMNFLGLSKTQQNPTTMPEQIRETRKNGRA